MTDLIPTRVHNLIIVDESGSMECIRKQAFTGMNETLQTIRMMQKKHLNQLQYVTLITFDSDHTKLHYDNTPADKTTDLRWRSYRPCAATPLYDAIGKGISKVKAAIEREQNQACLDSAERKQARPKVSALVEDGDHVLVTIITDGYENCSEEWTLKMVRTLIEKLKKQNWTFTLIGTDNLDVEEMAHSFAIDEHLEFQQDDAGTKAMFARERRSRERYNCCVEACAPMPVGKFFEEDEN
jgi:uncharacterized protein YegL